MEIWFAAGGALLVSVLVLAARRRQAARALCLERLGTFVDRHRTDLGLRPERTRRVVLAQGDREVAAIDLGRLTALSGRLPEDERTRFFRALTDAAVRRPRPLAESYELKRHGLQTLPRLAEAPFLLASPEPAPARHRDPAAAGLTTVYTLEATADDVVVYVSEAHLAEAGIDERDLHGVALAVLRQRFDESAVRRALAGGEVGRLEPEDGRGASRLLLLPEALSAGESLFAAAPAPGTLLFAAEREAVESALAAAGELAEPLTARLFHVRARGIEAAQTS